MGEGKIELSPSEATAYWWINTIRYRVRDMAVNGITKEGKER